MARSPEPQLTRIGSYKSGAGGKLPADGGRSSASSSSSLSSSSSDSGDDGSDSDGSVFEVERIERHRVEGVAREFFVRWLNYPDSERSWEPEDNLRDGCPLILDTYLDEHGLSRSANVASKGNGKGKGKRTVQSDASEDDVVAQQLHVAKKPKAKLKVPAVRGPEKAAKARAPLKPQQVYKPSAADAKSLQAKKLIRQQSPEGHRAGNLKSPVAGPSFPVKNLLQGLPSFKNKPKPRSVPPAVDSPTSEAAPAPVPSPPAAGPAPAPPKPSSKPFKSRLPPLVASTTTAVTPAVDSTSFASTSLPPTLIRRPPKVPSPEKPASNEPVASGSTTNSPALTIGEVRTFRERDREVAGPFSFPNATADYKPLAPGKTPTVDPRVRHSSVPFSSQPSPPPADAPAPPKKASQDVSAKRLRSSRFFEQHVPIFDRFDLPNACALALGVESGLAKRLAGRACSVVNQSGTQSDPLEGGESWALAVLLATIGSKQPTRLEDIEAIFLHREEASFELLAASYIALASRPQLVEFFTYGATGGVKPILCYGFAVIPTLGALASCGDMKAFLRFCESKPDVEVILHTASIVLAATPAHLFSDVRLKELIRGGDLRPLDPAQLPTDSPYFARVTMRDIETGKFDLGLSATAELELEDIQRYLVALRQSLPQRFRRFVIVGDRCLPASVVKCASAGIELCTWKQLKAHVDLAVF